MNIFTNISNDNMQKMLSCFEAVVRTYEPGEVIHELAQTASYIGLITKGKAHLYCIDYDGNMQIIEYLNKDDVFGELFTLPVGSLEYIIEADTRCQVYFIPYSHVVTPCSNSCEHHSHLINNLLLMSAKKSQELALRISLISRKSVRNKLMTYFEYMSDVTGSASFETHTSLSKLSDYLCVDRTSLMREIRYMNEEGIILSKGRKITLMGDHWNYAKENHSN